MSYSWLRAVSLVAGAASFCLVGCGGGLPAIGGDLETTSDKEALGDVDCSAMKVQEAPDLMGWDPASRANLNRLRKQGIVPVRYAKNGCNVELELLPNCQVKRRVSYKFEPYARRESKTANSKAELYAKLPIGAVNLESKVGGGRSLRTDYVLAGTVSLPAGYEFNAQNLAQGADCDRATHVISTIYVGGFALASGASRDIAVATSVFGAEAGGSGSDSNERLSSEGNASACEKALQDEQGKEQLTCNVPLRVNLLPIGGRERLSAVTAPSGDAAAASSGFSGECPAGMSKVEGGTFLFGKEQVGLPTYCIGTTETTVAEYQACIAAKKCLPPVMDVASRKDDCNFGKGDRGEHPMNCVTPDEAGAFCSAQGRRLPLATELFFAATAGDGRKYPWGNELDDSRVCGDRKDSGTCAVGAHDVGKSPAGVLGLAGNVAEMGISAQNQILAFGGSYVSRGERPFSAGVSGGSTSTAPTLGFRCVLR